MNSCNFIGGLGRDWEVEYNAEGKPRAKNSIAIRKYNGDTMWINVIIFNEKKIQTLTQYTKKGDQLGVETHLDVSVNDSSGKNIYYHSYVIDSFTFCGSKKDSNQQNAGQQGQQNNFQQNQQQQQGFQNGNQNTGGFSQQGFQGPPDDDIPF